MTIVESISTGSITRTLDIPDQRQFGRSALPDENTTSVIASIVIVEYKSPAQVETFLAHLAAQDVNSIEVLVYRNSCPASEPKLRAPEGLVVREARTDKNLGFGAAFNRAARLANGDVLLSCNADTSPSRSVLMRMIDEVGSGPKKLVAPILFNDHGEERGRPFYSPVRMIRARIPHLRQSAITGRPDWVVGACFAISREFFQSLRGFHPAFKLYLEDVDLCWRVRAAGGAVEVLHDRRVYHAHGRASSKLFSRPFVLHVRSGLAFFAVHPGALVGRGPRTGPAKLEGVLAGGAPSTRAA